jgi:hypothetical protein
MRSFKIYFLVAAKCNVYTHHLESIEFEDNSVIAKAETIKVAAVSCSNMVSTSKVYTKIIIKLQGNSTSKYISQQEIC